MILFNEAPYHITTTAQKWNSVKNCMISDDLLNSCLPIDGLKTTRSYLSLVLFDYQVPILWKEGSTNQTNVCVLLPSEHK